MGIAMGAKRAETNPIDQIGFWPPETNLHTGTKLYICGEVLTA